MTTNPATVKYRHRCMFTRCVSIFADDILLSTLILYYLSCNPLLLQPLSWREGENKGVDQIVPSRFNWISTFSRNLWLQVHKRGLGHVDIASLLALIRPLYELLTHSQRPGDAETSSTFRFNPPQVILSLETHASAAALLFMFRSPTRPPKPDGFWVSSYE